MEFKLPSIKYPPARPEEGYWSPVTSTINWCEEDYYATIYFAEIVNTLTNLLFLYLGVKGVRNCMKYQHDGVFTVAFIGYLLVGSGSFCFHSTLKYPWQLVDELSMIYTACLMCYATFSFPKSLGIRIALGVGMLSLAVFITAYYHYLQDPVFHQNAFAILTATIIFRAMYIMEVNIRPSFREKYRTVPPNPKKSAPATEIMRLANNERDRQIINEMWMLVGFGLSVFLGGFAIWGLDNQYCSTIRSWRHDVGLPWGLLLEGHGWWHIMTGFGSYVYIVWAIWLRHCLNERQDEYTLKWPSFLSIPEVVPRSELESITRKQYANGHYKSESRKSV